ncbi:MAG: recombinase family protein [Acutalibacteraceae bacterium]
MENTVVTIAPSIQAKQTMRVAAYCRVSSDSSDQLHSFAAQVQHYTKFIGENERMELADIYADEGITGTKTAKRDDFNRLVADCKKGKIDRVLTKSVSRFARNTADSLMYARLLKEYGVSILFEKENIDTAYMSSELLLALSGAQAQEESISISKNMRWSVERQMKSGTYLSSSTPYGYELKDGEFRIVEGEAEIVRLIFKSFLSGMGKKAIADMLNEMSAPKRFGYTTWRINTVAYILTNERYIGDALFQKNYTTDTLPFVKKPNRGEKAQYYVENMNPPIISKADFEAAQRLIKKSSIEQRSDIVSRPLTQKIRCKCGAAYTPICVGNKQYWGCKTHDFDARNCDSRRIPEKDIYDAFITMVNKLRNCRAEILPAAIAQTERLQMKAGGAAARIKEIDKEVAELNNKNLVLARLNTKGILRPAEYAEQSGVINSRVNALRAERRQLLQEQDENSILSGLRRLNDLLMGIQNPLTEFDEDLFAYIVEEITVTTDTSLCFKLIGGLPITEAIPAQRRCRRK